MHNALITTKQQSGESTRGGRPPVDKFQKGPFQVSIWQNPSAKGDFRTATMDRRYKNKEGQFQTSHSYSASDLDHLKAAREARERAGSITAA
jgi:hypothetical protein